MLGVRSAHNVQDHSVHRTITHTHRHNSGYFHNSFLLSLWCLYAFVVICSHKAKLQLLLCVVLRPKARRGKSDLKPKVNKYKM